MDKIISIDLDIVMTPYIGIYNNLVWAQDDRLFNWDKIKNVFCLDDFHVNEDYARQIHDILVNYSNQVEHIYMGYDHSTILNAIQSEQEKLNKSYQFDLYNIDYHHDLGYDPKAQNKLLEQNVPDCGTWVGFLNLNNCINSYTWYRGIGSNILNAETVRRELIPSNYKELLFNNNFPMDLTDVKIIYIATSSPWIPPKFDDEVFSKTLDGVFTPDQVQFINGVYALNGDRKVFLNRVE